MVDGSKGGKYFGTCHWEVALVSMTHCLLFYIYIKHVQKTQQLARKTHPPKNTLVGLLAVFCKEVIWSNPASRKQGSGSVNCHNLGYNSTKRAEITLVTLIYFLPVVGVISLYKFHVQIAIGSRWRDFPSKFPWESRANTITVRRIIANHTSVLRDPTGAGGCWSIPPKGTPRNGKGFLFSKLLRIVLVCFRGMLENSEKKWLLRVYARDEILLSYVGDPKAPMKKGGFWLLMGTCRGWFILPSDVGDYFIKPWKRGFLEWWYPTTMGFPTKNDHFGVFWGYFWKPPNENSWKVSENFSFVGSVIVAPTKPPNYEGGGNTLKRKIFQSTNHGTGWVYLHGWIFVVS